MNPDNSCPAIARARNPNLRVWLTGLRPKLLIGDRWTASVSGETLQVVDPTSESVLAVVASGQKADIDAAVGAARAAFEGRPWSRMSPSDRARLLRRFADLVEQHSEEFAELESLNNGMLLSLAKSLVEASVETIHYYAGATRMMTGETVATDSGFFNYTVREPLGVCGAITPWNGPIISAVQKIAPALAAGNTVVLKPAEQTPLSALRLGELAQEAGFPAGVFNVVTGFGDTAGSALVNHPDVDKVAFTGSTAVGKRILATAADRLAHVTLELGGKSPNIVFPDANLEQAIPAAVMGYATLTGQVCCAGSRVFVQQDFRDEFVEGLVRYTESLKLGDPLDDDTTMGPLASKAQLDRVKNYIDIGAAEGAVSRCKARDMPAKGYFVEPTVFDDVQNSMQIAQEEIFGPVVSVIPFKDENDAVRLANDTPYGLASALWTSDVTRAHAVAREIKSGTVYVNNILSNDVALPFGGYKQSGIGREGGPNWFEYYTQEKSVIVRL